MITDKQRDTIIQMYRDGSKIDDIVTETDVSRASVYYILRSRGIKTNRRTKTGDPAVGLRDVMDQLVECERRSTTYRNLLERVVAEGGTPPVLAEICSVLDPES